MSDTAEKADSAKKRIKRKITFSTNLEGIADIWEDNKSIRRASLRTKSLLQWISPEKVGVVTMNTVKLNVEVLIPLCEMYMSQAPPGKTSPVDLLKEQAFKFSGGSLCWTLHSLKVYPCKLNLISSSPLSGLEIPQQVRVGQRDRPSALRRTRASVHDFDHQPEECWRETQRRFV